VSTYGQTQGYNSYVVLPMALVPTGIAICMKTFLVIRKKTGGLNATMNKEIVEHTIIANHQQLSVPLPALPMYIKTMTQMMWSGPGRNFRAISNIMWLIIVITLLPQFTLMFYITVNIFQNECLKNNRVYLAAYVGGLASGIIVSTTTTIVYWIYGSNKPATDALEIHKICIDNKLDITNSSDSTWRRQLSVNEIKSFKEAGIRCRPGWTYLGTGNSWGNVITSSTSDRELASLCIDTRILLQITVHLHNHTYSETDPYET
jgi:hypothetical protein